MPKTEPVIDYEKMAKVTLTPADKAAEDHILATNNNARSEYLIATRRDLLKQTTVPFKAAQAKNVLAAFDGDHGITPPTKAQVTQSSQSLVEREARKTKEQIFEATRNDPFKREIVMSGVAPEVRSAKIDESAYGATSPKAAKKADAKPGKLVTSEKSHRPTIPARTVMGMNGTRTDKYAPVPGLMAHVSEETYKGFGKDIGISNLDDPDTVTKMNKLRESVGMEPLQVPVSKKSKKVEKLDLGEASITGGLGIVEGIKLFRRGLKAAKGLARDKSLSMDDIGDIVVGPERREIATRQAVVDIAKQSLSDKDRGGRSKKPTFEEAGGKSKASGAWRKGKRGGMFRMTKTGKKIYKEE